MPGRLTVDAVTSWLGIHLPPRSSSATLAGLLLAAAALVRRPVAKLAREDAQTGYSSH